ncbi:uncharacterized protein N7469_002246 [Penicillium citrinum]|uniref:DUF7703 domain-containing protein n=1 Tax=Penicillium citrinum TaxID=5077 RepID=A0A9W9TTC3_PENCI|nr:uncharacterized protein N7469_002246 [Penicillium citrinum]KAJ5240655.1 hypothetical protein N7469_002246 [Penicillium citrinum]
MDTTVARLPPAVGALLMENIGIVQIVSMFSIGAYNALETGLVTFDALPKHRGLYFWSMQAASWGILVHAIPAMARFISQSSNLATSIPFMLGWYAMVTGHAVVLYSRLHLIAFIRFNPRWVLWMIIMNAVALHVPMTVLFFSVSNGQPGFARPAAVFDRIQLIGFCIQELVIYSLYIYCTSFLFKVSPAVSRPGRRKVLIHTICVNAFVVFMNILLIVTEFKLHYIQVSFKTVVYSIKLKLEFSVLNRLSSYFFTPVSLQVPEPKQDDTNASSARLTHSRLSGGMRNESTRSNGAQEQQNSEGSPNGTSIESYDPIDVIYPLPSLTEDCQVHVSSDWSGQTSELELTRSCVSAKSDV